MNKGKSMNVAVVVAHPDDETLWAGGMILSHPEWNCSIVCLCRKSDSERAQKFFMAMDLLHSTGVMGDLDDGPDQVPLENSEVESAILDLLPPKKYDLIMTHNLTGEYTRHLRHEEVSKAILRLWLSGKLAGDELRTFAYEDGKKTYFPLAIKEASIYQQLSQEIWAEKYSLITDTYGFETESWEARTTPHAEAFWQFKDRQKANIWLNRFEWNLMKSTLHNIK